MPPDYERKIAVLQEKFTALFDSVQGLHEKAAHNADHLMDLRIRVAHGERLDKTLGWALGVIYVAVVTVAVKVLITKLGG